jgi:hypothetical protein
MHPVVETHLGSNAGGGPGAADATGYRTPDAPAAGIPRVTFGDSERTPHTVASMAVVSLLGLALLRLSGFRFVVGGAAGIIR